MKFSFRAPLWPQKNRARDWKFQSGMKISNREWKFQARMKISCVGEWFFSCVRARMIFFDPRALWGFGLYRANGRGRSGDKLPEVTQKPFLSSSSLSLQRQHWESSKVLAGLVFCEMLSQYPQSAFQGEPGGGVSNIVQFGTQTLRVHLLGLDLGYVCAFYAPLLRSEKLQNESSPNFSNFCPGFCPEFFSEFSPNFSRIYRASFRGDTETRKNSPKIPAIFFNAKFPGKKKKKLKIFLESRQSNHFPSPNVGPAKSWQISLQISGEPKWQLLNSSRRMVRKSTRADGQKRGQQQTAQKSACAPLCCKNMCCA